MALDPLIPATLQESALFKSHLNFVFIALLWNGKGPHASQQQEKEKLCIPGPRVKHSIPAYHASS